MSDMIINDTVPVDKKINELFKYNIFIMKLVELVISTCLMMLPFFIRDTSSWHSHCLAVSPTLVLSLMFIILYFVDQVHDLAEQLYLVIQLVLNLGAMVEALVVALVLNIIPHIVAPVDLLHCLVAAPTLMLSLIFILLYIVDQVLAEAEMYYVVGELFLSAVALITVIVGARPAGAVYGLFYLDLIIALGIDLYYIVKERGWTF